MRNLKITIATILLTALFLGGEALASFTYSITGGANDGREEQSGNPPGTWVSSGSNVKMGCQAISGGKTTTQHDFHGATLFEDVNIPQGTEILSAKYRLNVASITAGSPSLIVYAQYAQSAPDFSADKNLPTGMWRTPQSSTWTPTQTGWNEIDVTEQIQYLFDRTDWNGGDIKLAVYDNITFLTSGCGGGSNYITVNQYENSPTLAPELVVTTVDHSVVRLKAGGETKIKAGGTLKLGQGEFEPERTPGEFGTQFTPITDYLQNTDPTGFEDSKSFTLSFWLKRDDGGVERFYAINPSRKFNPSIGTAGTFEILGRNSAGSNVLLMTGNTTLNNFVDWYHIIISVDLTDTAKRHIYINDGAETLNVTTYVDDLIDFTGTSYLLANLNSNNGCACRLSEFYLNVGEYIDLSVEANRRKFRTADGKPVDLGKFGELPTGSRPEVYMPKGDGVNHSLETASYTNTFGRPTRVAGPGN